VPLYVARLIHCDETETATQVSTGGAPAKIGDVITVDRADWRVQKIVDSGIDQIDEALICTSADGCNYELVLQNLTGSPAPIVENFHADVPLVPSSTLKVDGRPWEVVRSEESGRDGVRRLICRLGKAARRSRHTSATSRACCDTSP
jgi:hypothetical protein